MQRPSEVPSLLSDAENAELSKLWLAYDILGEAMKPESLARMRALQDKGTADDPEWVKDVLREQGVLR